MKSYIALFITFSAFVSVNCKYNATVVAFKLVLEARGMNATQNLAAAKHSVDAMVSVLRAWQYGLTAQGLKSAAAINEKFALLILDGWTYAPNIMKQTNQTYVIRDAIQTNLALSLSAEGYKYLVNEWHNKTVEPKANWVVLARNYTENKNKMSKMIDDAIDMFDVKRDPKMESMKIWYDFHMGLKDYFKVLFKDIDSALKQSSSEVQMAMLLQHLLDQFEINFAVLNLRVQH